MDPETGEVLSDIKEATHQVMKNLDAILREAGSDFSKVVKTTIFVDDLENFGTVNEIYASYLTEGAYPARETVQAARLPKDVKVEISMIAQL